MASAVVLPGTLETKGAEIHHLHDTVTPRRAAMPVTDTGILDAAACASPDVARSEALLTHPEPQVELIEDDVHSDDPVFTSALADIFHGLYMGGKEVARDSAHRCT